MTTKVIFRKFKDGEVIAIFPNELYDWINKDLVWSYMHIGQHGAASKSLAEEKEIALPEEYANLQEELESIGYVLDITA